ncbi:MAG: hypothetical protein ABMA14_21425 [Hyphomonadaceae bacterium]
MLDLAAQFGSFLGDAIRESFAESDRQWQIIQMQQAWELEQAKVRAAEELELQRQRNQNLLAGMQGVIGASELGRTQLGTETLHLLTTDEMFNTPGNARGVLTQDVPVAASIDLTEMQAANEAYFDAMSDVNDADQAVREEETNIANSRDVLAYVDTHIDQLRAHIALLQPGSMERPTLDAEIASYQEKRNELVEWQADYVERLTRSRIEADQARLALRAVEKRRATSAEQAESAN